jgi:pimeloyl-ACP methyl ester carboxylesterase
LIIGGMPHIIGPKKIVNILYQVPFLKRSNTAIVIKEFGFLNKANLSKLKLPVLLLYSTGDKLATPKMAKELDKIIPNSKLVIINYLNHSWLMHRIDQSGFLNTINDFLKSE